MKFTVPLVAVLFAISPRAFAPPIASATPESAKDDGIVELSLWEIEASAAGNEDESQATHVHAQTAVNASVLPAVKLCYRRLLEQKPAARGEVHASFRIEEGGIGSVSVTADPALGTPIEKCVKGAVQLLRFRADDAGATVKFPLRMRPAIEPAAPPERERHAETKIGVLGAVGSLDSSQIAAVVARHRSELSWCYEKELAQKPSLAGKVSVRFVIGASGSVSSATMQSSTLGDKNVESCVLARVKAMAFPKPTGGGIVVVSYPFEFASAN